MKLIDKILLESMLKPNVDAIDKIKQIITIGGKDAPSKCALYVKNWFAGSFMGGRNKDRMGDLEQTFNILQKVYGSPEIGKIYRAIHLRVDKNATNEDIMRMNSIVTGPASYQSWSFNKEGAMWFFKHFAVDQNQHGDQEKGKAWVLVESTSQSTLSSVITALKLNQFFSDCYKALDAGLINFAYPEVVKQLATDYNSNDMAKQSEVVCKITGKVKVKVLNIMVPNLI